MHRETEPLLSHRAFSSLGVSSSTGNSAASGSDVPPTTESSSGEDGDRNNSLRPTLSPGVREAPAAPSMPYPERSKHAHTNKVDAGAEVARILKWQRDYYMVLKVKRDADVIDIKKQYHRLCRIIHPDKCEDPAANEAFMVVSSAYSTLVNSVTRTLYDAYLLEVDNYDGSYHDWETKHKQVNHLPKWLYTLLRIPFIGILVAVLLSLLLVPILLVSAVVLLLWWMLFCPLQCFVFFCHQDTSERREVTTLKSKTGKKTKERDANRRKWRRKIFRAVIDPKSYHNDVEANHIKKPQDEEISDQIDKPVDTVTELNSILVESESPSEVHRAECEDQV
mmetsp:Transcript_37112/g.51508  ORF Transcript_37112/g.51508 Transcript_37112/m.51508 type:complete len:336 (+) Transcript_37112:123-1130(+)|eukprot:CAMPEP_0196578690 /NCGR_PEP_ID=MMETSP1081-20130531/7543_1 /TAXON_ID=36882 /ORGANISM="Pyramimonas amylifera, Strain CCMP720" /LENGTH=335 /DNA_ID=CAMNT_0041897985 /DNA_START=114 /DNA_END=1121 /DNA_ORIENTATION=+